MLNIQLITGGKGVLGAGMEIPAFTYNLYLPHNANCLIFTVVMSCSNSWETFMIVWFMQYVID